MIGGTRIMSIQDYVYFRIYKYYEKKKDIPVMTGIYFVFVVQYCVIFFFASVFNLLTGGWFSSENMSKELFWVLFLGLAIFLFAINLIRYLNPRIRSEIERKYKATRLNKTIKLWQIFTIPIWIIAITFVMILLLGNPPL